MQTSCSIIKVLGLKFAEYFAKSQLQYTCTAPSIWLVFDEFNLRETQNRLLEVPYKIQKSLNDFELIKIDYSPIAPSDFNLMHLEALKFLKSAFNENKTQKVVITHHVPTFQNYPSIYKGSALNEAFGVELCDLIMEYQPAFWIYGHHHFPTPPFQVGKTWLLNNQLGYVKISEHVNYRQMAVFEL